MLGTIIGIEEDTVLVKLGISLTDIQSIIK